MTKHLLAVCTANLCRSPMAEGLLRHYITQAGLAEQVTVLSAGTFATPDKPALDFTVEAMAQRGIDISTHKTRQITPDLLRLADLILVMDEEHRRSVFYHSPSYLAKTLLFSELSGDNAYIYDPYGLDKTAYARTRDILETYIRSGWPVLLQRLKLSPESVKIPLPSV